LTPELAYSRLSFTSPVSLPDPALTENLREQVSPEYSQSSLSDPSVGDRGDGLLAGVTKIDMI